MDISTLLAVLVGSASTFAGVAYAERKRDQREKDAEKRTSERDTLLKVQEAIVAYEAAAIEWHTFLRDRWLSQLPSDQRVWPYDPTTSGAHKFMHAGLRLATLRSQLDEVELRDQIEALQDETGAILTLGPGGTSDAELSAFDVRVAARTQSSLQVVETVGASYRDLG